jgi:hypothetical protein
LPSSIKKIRLATPEPSARHHHYIALAEQPGIEWLGVVAPPWEDSLPAKVDAVIVSCEYFLGNRLAIAACQRFGIPTYHVLDGILEWRNLFENPRTTVVENGAPLYRPLISDHTFAMGEIQRLTLQWLGNDNVHAFGLPRFDALPVKPCRVGHVEGRPKVLIATANTPWFSDEQKTRFCDEFGHLVDLLRPRSDLAIEWRVAEPVAVEFGLANSTQQPSTVALQSAAALITTPSSLVIESMRLGVPTLVFDPYACPILNPSAWHATSANTVLQLLHSLLAPDDERAGLQNTLRDFSAPKETDAAKKIAEFLCHPTRDCVSAPSAFAALDAPHSCQSEDWKKIAGLAVTVTALEKKIREQSCVIGEFTRAHNHPNFRKVCGVIWRWCKSNVYIK